MTSRDIIKRGKCKMRGVYLVTPPPRGQCNLEHATCIDPVTDRIIFVDPQHINPLAWLTIQMTAMSFDQCDPMKW